MPKILPFPSTPWFTIKNQTEKSADIYIYDEISPYLPDTSAKDVVAKLASLKDVATLNVHINSPGGSVFDGMAIYNALARHAGEVIVYVDGLAASIASVIAMAGKRIIIARNANLMIHLPSCITIGTAKDLRKTADTLDMLENSIAEVYKARTKLSLETLKALMSDETWYSAEDAVRTGFADEVFEGVQAVAKFDLEAFGYAHAPKPEQPISPAPTPENTSKVAPRILREKKVALLEKFIVKS